MSFLYAFYREGAADICNDSLVCVHGVHNGIELGSRTYSEMSLDADSKLNAPPIDQTIRILQQINEMNPFPALETTVSGLMHISRQSCSELARVTRRSHVCLIEIMVQLPVQQALCLSAALVQSLKPICRLHIRRRLRGDSDSHEARTIFAEMITQLLAIGINPDITLEQAALARVSSISLS